MEKQKPDFEIEFTQVIFSIAKSVFSISIKPDRLEIMHKALRKVESLINKVAERKAVQVAEKLQKATSDGFINFAQDMAALDARIKELENKAGMDGHKTFPLKPLSQVPANAEQHPVVHEYDQEEFED